MADINSEQVAGLRRNLHIDRVAERWQPFVSRFGYRPPALERCAA